MKSGEPHKKNGREMGEITKGGLGGVPADGARADRGVRPYNVYRGCVL